MRTVIVFSGTTEGRTIAGVLRTLPVHSLIYVATEYGLQVMEDERAASDSPEPSLSGSALQTGENQEVHIGRLNRDAMCRLFREAGPALVIDATHPYAVIATENIAGACADEKVPCLRVGRENGGVPGAGTEKTGDDGREEGKVIEVLSAQEAAAYLEQQEGNIFLTTGSKELDAFSSLPGFSERVFARVLPSASNFEKCAALGLHGRNLIMMQGPFSEELNVAMFRSCHARWMVTKAAGRTGGFPEKMRAAQKLGIGAVVIKRPEEMLPEGEQRMTLREAEDYLIRKFAKEP